MVDASVSIADLSRYLGADLPEDGDYHTLSGLLHRRRELRARAGAGRDVTRVRVETSSSAKQTNGASSK